MTQHTINSILLDDHSTTYNLALLCAMIDIAQNSSSIVTIKPDGVAQVPYRQIVDQWLEYYFPLIRDSVPQMPGGRAMAFQESFARLIRKNKVSTLAELLKKGTSLADLRAEISNTIHRGPVVYAKGLEGEKLFNEYKLDGGKHWHGLEVSAELWNELKLHGLQIRESLMAVWTTVSSDFRKNPET